MKIMIKNSVWVLCLALIITTPISRALNEPSMGQVDFPALMTQNGQRNFIKGLLSLHNFFYEEARTYFQTAERYDSKSVLPYWGEAMTYNHPLWSEVNLDAGRAVLMKLGKTTDEQLQKAQNQKERGLIKAAQALYSKDDKLSRDNHYLAILAELHEQYPHDNEIASFYALALLGSTEGQRDVTTYMRAAAIVEQVNRKNPNHPGAIHYLIHAFDDPVHAPLGLFYAKKYSEIAPDASHALHMPSHIYLALGLWNDVILSNKRAWLAGQKNNPNHDPFKYTVHDFHALQWLSYGYLQKLDYKKAFDLVKQMEKITSKNPSPMAKWYYAMMRAAYITESQDWKADLNDFNMTGIELNSTGNNTYVNSLILLNTTNNGADKQLTPVLDTLKILCKAIPNKKVEHCGEADYFTSTTDSGINTGKIILLEIRAQLALKNKKTQTAIQLLQAASTLEEATPFGYGPPSPVKPAEELLADVYFTNQEFQKAYLHYQNSLKRAPNRALSFIGLKKSRQHL